MASLIIVVVVVIAMLLTSGLTAWIIWKFEDNRLTSTSFFSKIESENDICEGKKSVINSPAREARILDNIYQREMKGEFDNNADI